MKRVIKVGNAQGFWGDRSDAPARLAAQVPDLDYLTLDYLAEVSLSIMAIQREKEPQSGYARDFLEVVRSLVPAWRGGSTVRLVANAGGLNPLACARGCRAILQQSGLDHLKIGVVAGDDVLPWIRNQAAAGPACLNQLETGEPIAAVADRLVTANAYLGAAPIAQVLGQGATIVVTGRVADPSLTVGCCLHHFGWPADDWNKIAGATVAGHLIECGTQVTGGIATDWMSYPRPEAIGFPVAEIDDAGRCVITKPADTGGRVDARTVKEQLVYEIGDPARYLSPDANVSFLGLAVTEIDPDRVLVEGAIGSPPSDHYKVSATYRDGYTAAGMVTIFGAKAVQKGRRAGEALLERLRQSGVEYARTLIECLGANACVPNVIADADEDHLTEIVLRVAVADARKDAVEQFAREIAPLVTSGPPGVTGYATGRPKVRPVFGYWPCLVPRHVVTPTVATM